MDNTAVQSVHIRVDKLGSSVGLREGETTEKTGDVAASECPGALPVGPCGSNQFGSSPAGIWWVLGPLVSGLRAVLNLVRGVLPPCGRGRRKDNPRERARLPITIPWLCLLYVA
eukprot:4902631-Pleurochrysis_carterae.AAC.1